MRWRRTVAVTRTVGALALAAGLLLVGLPPVEVAGAAAPGDAPYQVTLAARSCGTYAEIMANRARNNIQESLRDLGKNSVYTGGQPIDPTLEQANDPACTPLDGWRFQLGAGIASGKVDFLSVVSTPGRLTAPTASVPLLDPLGQPTGGTLGGAVTLQLTQAELDRALRANLWVQGGSVTDPLLYAGTNATRVYGFGALRCSVDNLNGDNVEYVTFPTGTRHVLCFYYTVRPAPTAGTIVVRKTLESGTDTHSFSFNGNVSYVPGGAFEVPVVEGRPGQVSFDRAAGQTWSFQELPDPGFEAAGPPVCVSSTGESTASVEGQAVDVQLGAEDVMTCTFTNRRAPTGLLQLYKVTRGGVGTFGFTVERPDGSSAAYTATTQRAEDPVLVAANPSGPSGPWTVTETLPTDPGGTWALTGAECNGVDVPVTGTSATIDIAAGAELNCVATNTFTPAGAITIDKTTRGGVGQFWYVVRDDDAADDAPRNPLVQTATTTAEGDPARATGDELSGLDVYTPLAAGGQEPVRHYSITEVAPAVATGDARWELESVTCGDNTTSVDLEDGVVRLTLSPADTLAACSFTNVLVPYPTLAVTKVVTGDPAARASDVVVEVRCQGPEGSLPYEVTITGSASTEGPYTLPDQPVLFAAFPQTCVVTETATGAAPGATVSTSFRVTGGTTTASTPTSRTVTFDRGDDVAVELTDAYTAAPTTTPTPTPTSTSVRPTTRPTDPTTVAGDRPGVLARTGTDVLVPTVLLGAGLVVVGVMLLLARRRRT